MKNNEKITINKMFSKITQKNTMTDSNTTKGRETKLNFDKLKMVLRYSSDKRPFIVLNPQAFTVSPDGTHFYRDAHTGLEIEYNKIPLYNNDGRKQLVIQYTPQILKEEFHKLINRDNIFQCFKNLNNLNLILVHITPKLLDEFGVVLADVTIDKKASESFIKEFEDYTVVHFKNTLRNDLTLPRYPQSNLVMANRVKNRKYLHRFTVYNKYDEVKRMQPIHRLPHDVVEQFKGTYRLERNLKSKQQVKEALNITSEQVTLREVLNAQAQPFIDVYKKFVQLGAAPLEMKKRKEESIRLICKKYKYDLVKIEYYLRQTYKSYSRRLLEPYQQVCAEHQKKGSLRDMSIVKAIKDFLKVPNSVE